MVVLAAGAASSSTGSSVIGAAVGGGGGTGGGNIDDDAAVIVVSLDDYCQESEAIDALSDDVVLARATPASLQSAVAAAMLRGWFDLCRNLIVHGRSRADNKVDFTSVVYQTKSKINSQLKAMTNAIRGKGAVSTVAPAFEWAQSDDVVAINVKLAHKLDTPATLDCKSTDKMITFAGATTTAAAAAAANATGADGVVDAAATTPAYTSYTFRAECLKSGKNFLLQLKLWGAVRAEGATWE